MIQRLTRLLLDTSRGGLLAVSIALCAAPAHAVTVLDTFGPGDTAPGQNWAVYTTRSTDDNALAVPFSLAAPSTLNSILTSIDGSGSFNLRIVSSSGGLPSATVLY